jgi:ABC-type multidrug transport system fused ATPase/permease subunit
MNYFSKRLRVAYREARTSLSFLNSFFAERMGGMPTVQLMNMEEHERRRFDRLSETYFVKQMGSVHVFAYFHPSITILTAASIALTLYFGGGYVIDQRVPIGVFVSFLAYVQVLFQPVRGLTEKYNIYQNAMSSAERIFGALELKEEEGLRKDNTSLTGEPRLTGEIRFDHVSFSYSEKMDTWALRDANFHITPQERIAVVGHSGAGKSTLLSLLFRFYQPQRGSILLDGRPIESFSKHFLRRRLGFVQQDVFIFAGTIRENLTLLGDSITEEKLNAACDATGMNQILARLEAGLETRLDERGSNLSLGERQVLAITRVLLQDPDILILDEATSHVDNSTERLLQKAIEQVTKNRTSILIAHRLSTIRDADRIFVFEKGAIVESGTHDELVTAQGAYYSFSKLQTL